MNRFRMPLLFMTVGFALKLAGMVICRVNPRPELMFLLTTCDPLGVYLAQIGTAAVFQRGLAPRGQGAFYEALLILTFALQCFILGLMIDALRNKKFSHRH